MNRHLPLCVPRRAALGPPPCVPLCVLLCLLLCAVLPFHACSPPSGRDADAGNDGSVRIDTGSSGNADGATQAFRGTPAAPGKVIVLGLDAATWDVMDPLLEKGELPNIAALLARGCRAPLRTLYPTISPTIWTSIATGVPAALHGRDFTVTRIPGSYRFSQDTGSRLTYPLEWQVADYCGLRSVTANWYSADAPWEPKHSRVLADRIRDDRAEPLRFPPFELPGIHFRAPDDARLIRRLDLAASPDDFTSLRKWLRHELNVLRWRQGEDGYIHRASRHLLFEAEGGQPDLAMIFFRGLDGVQHKFWEFMDEEHFPETRPDERRLFGGMIAAYYRYYDHIVGDFVSRAEPDTTFVLLSDHGMEAINAQKGRTCPADERVHRHMSLYRPSRLDRLLEALSILALDEEGGVDWSRTIAFPNRDKALTWEVGLFLNVKGREPEGSVPQREYESMLANVAGLLETVHTGDGEPLFLDVATHPGTTGAEITARINAGLDLSAVLYEGRSQASMPVALMPRISVPGEAPEPPRQLTLGDILEPYDMSGAHHFAPDGILVVSGPSIRPGSRLESASVYDVAPTLNMLLGLPVADDFAGEPLTSLLVEEARKSWSPVRVASFRGVVPGFPAGAAPGESPGSSKALSPMTPEEAERLKSLGYIQ